MKSSPNFIVVGLLEFYNDFCELTSWSVDKVSITKAVKIASKYLIKVEKMVIIIEIITEFDSTGNYKFLD